MHDTNSWTHTQKATLRSEENKQNLQTILMEKHSSLAGSSHWSAKWSPLDHVRSTSKPWLIYLMTSFNEFTTFSHWFFRTSQRQRKIFTYYTVHDHHRASMVNRRVFSNMLRKRIEMKRRIVLPNADSELVISAKLAIICWLLLTNRINKAVSQPLYISKFAEFQRWLQNPNKNRFYLFYFPLNYEADLPKMMPKTTTTNKKNK